MDSKSSKAKRFQDMFSFFEEGLVTVEQADELFKAIIDIIEKFQKKTDLSLTEQDQAIADFGYQIADIYAQMTDRMGGQKVSFEKQIAELKKEIADIVVEDGEDADEDEIVERVLDVVEDRLEEVRSLIPDIKEKTAEELLALIGDIPLNQVSGLDGRLQEMNNDMHKLSNELVNKVPRIEVFSSGEKIGSAHRINFTGATVTFENGRVNVAVTGGGGLSDGDKGDITVSGSGTVWTIDNDTIGLDELSATGTPSAATFLRGDNTWAVPPGSSGGITRSVSSISTPTTAGDASVTDYVYNVTNTTLTLPTAVGNTNQYTIKCISGTCVVEGDGTETIEGDLNITIQVDDSVDLISNNTEWKVV